MRIFSFDDVVSTSSLASQWLEKGKHQPPFAIIAASQEQGRGRHGRNWQSPVGNIYLSIAIGADNTGLRKLQLLPLKAGVVIANWFREQFGLSITLKWPNDILFGGAKLGGILCESTVRGRDVSHAIIGVGININKHPKITGDYQSTSLSQILGQTFDPEKLARSLVKYSQQVWDDFSDERVLEAFSWFGVDDGHIWQNSETNERYCFEGIAADGTMMLQKKGKEGELLSVNSAHQDLRWIYQNIKSPQPVYVADIGNSRTKLAKFISPQADTPEKTLVFSEPSSRDLAAFWGKDDLPLFAFSVNNKAKESLQAVIESQGKSFVELRKRRIYSFGDSYAFGTMGADRLAAIEAAIRDSKSPQSIVVVSAGTATTVDLISSTREHLGGWIVPGVITAMQSLSDKTANLPDLGKVLPEAGPSRLGIDTPSAMMGGVVNMTLGLIERGVNLLAKHDKTTADRVQIKVTGGFGPWITANNKKARLDPDLILKGIKVILTGGS